jgi:hypothetical protein
MGYSSYSYGSSSIDEAEKLIEAADNKSITARDADAINDLQTAINILSNCDGEEAVNLKKLAEQKLSELVG